jgi:hypothetical protein
MQTIEEGALSEIALNKLRHHETGVVLSPLEAAALLTLIEAWRWERT